MHRIVRELENLAALFPYLQILTQPTTESALTPSGTVREIKHTLNDEEKRKDEEEAKVKSMEISEDC